MKRGLSSTALVAAWLLAGCGPRGAAPDRVPAAPSGGERVAIRGMSDGDAAFWEAYAQTGRFQLGEPNGFVFTPDSKYVLYLSYDASQPGGAGPRAGAPSPRQSLYVLDVAAGTHKVLVDADDFLHGAKETLSAEQKARRERQRTQGQGFTSFELVPGHNRVFLTLADRMASVEIPSGRVAPIVETGAPPGAPAPFDAKVSPDARWVSFVRQGELFVLPAEGGVARPLTRGADELYEHATAEFIAQEEMDRFTGYWWSPDSRFIVYQVTDHSAVERLQIGDPASPENAAPTVPYPRPGKANATVTLELARVDGGARLPLRVVWDHDTFPYLASVVWQKNGPLTLLVETRDQRDLAVLRVDTQTGKTSEIFREHDDVWINLDAKSLVWLAGGRELLWATERQGAWQLELRSEGGERIRALTEPDLGYRQLVHVDADAHTVIVAAGAEPVEQQIYEIALGGGPPHALAGAPGFHEATFSPRGDAYVLRTQDKTTPLEVSVRARDGNLLGSLPVAPLPFLPRVTVAKTQPSGFWSALVYPRDFDPRKRYPVLVFAYGGPHVNIVRAQPRSYLKAQWYADHGFIVASVDAQGTPGRGRAFERVLWQKFAEVPLAGQVRGLGELAQREPAMDLSRVGIFGTSFGGYLAALAVLRRPDVFHAAVAAAPVADWLDYDTHYTERYLGVPRAGDAAALAVYSQNGLTEYARGLLRPLLIVHGTADDNVHFVHSLKLADALFRAHKEFEFLPMIGKTHNLEAADSIAMFHARVLGFFQRTLP